RVGFVYLGVNNQVGTAQANRPASAYTVPFNFVDAGPDGKSGTADDANLTFYGIPNSQVSGCTATQTTPTANCLYPTNQVVVNAPNNGTYKTVEFSLNKRQSHNWSAQGGFGYTWQKDYPTTGYPETPNGPGCASGSNFTAECNYSFYSAKATGTYNFP